MRFFNRSSLITIITAFCVAFLFQACSDNSTGINYDSAPPPFDTANADSSFTTEDGLQVYIIEEGYGDFEVIPRDRIQARYTGRTDDGEIFESTYRNGSTEPGILQNLTPLPITSPTGQTVSPLVDGFRRGLMGMKEGEKRKIIVPPSLGYEGSQRGTRGYQLRNETLHFDVELVEIL